MEQKEYKTLEALQRAMMTCNGQQDTVCTLWGMNDHSATASAFIGDGDVLATILTTVLTHVGEQRATPAEMAITRSILEAVAAADLRHKGQLLETIRMYQQQMQTEQTDIGADNQEGRLTVRRGPKQEKEESHA